MRMMLRIELKKIQHTFLQALILVSVLGAIAMLVLLYSANSKKTFLEVMSSYSVFVQMIPFAVTVIFGCFVVAREYKESMVLYLRLTPQSQVKIMLSKLFLIILEVCFTQIITFAILFFINTGIDGYATEELVKYIEAGLISAGAFSCLAPLIVFISLMRRSISGAVLLFLIIFMLTFPFAFSENGAALPYLLPMILVAKFMGNTIYTATDYWYMIFALLASAALFLWLSIRKFNNKE